MSGIVLPAAAAARSKYMRLRILKLEHDGVAFSFLHPGQENRPFCVCREGYNSRTERMIRCDQCREWFHQNCIGMAYEKYKKALRMVVWMCDDCQYLLHS